MLTDYKLYNILDILNNLGRLKINLGRINLFRLRESYTYRLYKL